MNKIKFYLLSFLAIGIMAFSFTSCEDDEVIDAPTVTVFASVDGYQVAFTSTVTDVDTYAWDFGDGETGTDANPAHTYATSGTFTATLTVTGGGGTASATSVNTIAASELEMLTGTEATGKTWVFSTLASEGDGLFKVGPDPMEMEQPLLDGVLGLIGLPADEYQDGFTFKPDMSYTHTTVNDSSVTSTIFAMVNQLPFRMAPEEDGISLTPFTPAVGATFTYTEDSDLTLEVVDPDDDELTSSVTWNNVGVLEILGEDEEFVGLRDFTKKYMILDISVDKLQVAMFMSTSQGSNIMLPKHVLTMTFVPQQ